MEFAKLSAPSLKDLFVQQLQGMILSGALPVGTQLPPERVLAEQMQVSRTVVNSGLAELSGQGFLEVRPRQGTCVADYRRRGNLSTLIAIMQYKGGALGKEEIRSILEVRRALEELIIEGYPTNAPLAHLIMHDPEFVRGRYETGFLDKNLERRRPPLPFSTSWPWWEGTALCR